MNSQAYRLMHEGTLALADVERNGIRVDVGYCYTQRKKADKHIKELENDIGNSKEVQLWKEIYGDKFNMDSPKQLSDILFKHLKIKSVRETKKGNPSVDKDSLDAIDFPFVQTIVELRKYKKISNTYLKNIIEETGEDGLLRPSFSLNIAKTFRSSSFDPNFQNLPIRDPEMGKIIRRAFIPRPKSWIGGVDYEGIEVKISACYHKDKTMLEYINHPESDMHRDMAMECYLLKKKEVNKDTRYCAKNNFVFPQFYGDWYESCAKSLWGSIDKMNLETKFRKPLREHLREQGITSYTQFEKHIQKVEDRFWNEKFKDYTKWKNKWVRQYERRGYIDMLTGFRCSGVMKRNDVINYPIQGAAFHCLLWSLIRLNKWLKRNKMRSMIVGQIHDEITMDIHEEERQEVLEKAREIMCVDIREAWPWIIVPLSIECEFSAINWHEKKVMEI